MKDKKMITDKEMEEKIKNIVEDLDLDDVDVNILFTKM